MDKAPRLGGTAAKEKKVMEEMGAGMSLPVADMPRDQIVSHLEWLKTQLRWSKINDHPDLKEELKERMDQVEKLIKALAQETSTPEADEPVVVTEETQAPETALAVAPIELPSNAEKGTEEEELAPAETPPKEAEKVVGEEPLSPEEIAELQKIQREVEKLPEVDREDATKGLWNIGFRVEKAKNIAWAKLFGFFAKTNLDQDKYLTSIMRELSEAFKRDAKNADKRAKDMVVKKGNWKTNLMSPVLLAGNIYKYGRIITDITGKTVGMPYRYFTMAGMAVTRVADAAKEAHLKTERVSERTRIKDAEKAAEEAWRIYEEAQKKIGEGKEVSIEDLQNFYVKELPKDLLRRLQEPAVASNFAQKIAKWDIGLAVKGLNKKIDKINANEKYSAEEKEKRILQLLNGIQWKNALRDYDRMITELGTVDEIATAAIYTKAVGRGLVGGALAGAIEVSLGKFWESLHSSSATLVAETTGPAILQNETVAGPYAEENAEFIRNLGMDKDLDPSHRTAFNLLGEQEEVAQHVPQVPEVGAEMPTNLGDATGENLSEEARARLLGALDGEIKPSVRITDTELTPTGPVEVPKTPEPGTPAPDPVEGAPAVAAAAVVEDLAKTEVVVPREISTDFSVKLGEGDVPKNLETVFHAISANHMDIPVSGTINEEFATKSLNMAANLVRLSEGHGIPGIGAEDFAKVASFKDGVLQITDHEGFNEILSDLETHSDKLWEKGVLQGEGAAITYIPKISQDSWLNIIHADGLEKGLDAGGESIETGILGHDEITAEQIDKFSDSDLVKKATAISSTPSAEELTARIKDSIDNPTITETVTPSTPEPAPAPTETLPSGEKINPDNVLKETNRIPPATRGGIFIDGYGRGGAPSQTPGDGIFINGYGDSLGYRPPGFNRGLPAYEDILVGSIDNPIPLSPEILQQVDAVYDENITHFFSKNIDTWRNLDTEDAVEIINLEDVNTDVAIKPFVAWMKELKELSGLEPKGDTLTDDAETTREFIKRALQRVAQTGQLDELKK